MKNFIKALPIYILGIPALAMWGTFKLLDLITRQNRAGTFPKPKEIVANMEFVERKNEALRR